MISEKGRLFGSSYPRGLSFYVARFLIQFCVSKDEPATGKNMSAGRHDMQTHYRFSAYNRGQNADRGLSETLVINPPCALYDYM